MSLDNIRKISIREYLKKIGVEPTKENERRGMYCSPLREEKNASFSVDYIRNVWFDHGLNKGGSIIDLVAQMKNCSVGEAIAKLEELNPDCFSFQRNIDSQKDDPSISIQKIMPLTHQSLLQYLDERCINLDIAKESCQEIYYSVANKNYFAIGFKNNSGGFELRNKYFQGCTNKDITIYTCIDNKSDTCIVFEGFIDYLSFLTLRDIDKPKVNAVILNSVSNLSKAIGFIKSHSKIYCFLDNDEAGRKAALEIKKTCLTVIDKSSDYSKYKDLNDYLKSQRLEANKKSIKPTRLRLKM